jgi:hypothetical protein
MLLTGGSSSSWLSTQRPRRPCTTFGRPDDYFKTTEFCSMCGPRFCPMHNFREVNWSALKRAAEKLPAES